MAVHDAALFQGKIKGKLEQLHFYFHRLVNLGFYIILFDSNTLHAKKILRWKTGSKLKDLVFRCLQYIYFENTAGKGEIAQISPFPAMFSTLSEDFPQFSSKLKLSSTNSLGLDKSKICCLGKG